MFLSVTKFDRSDVILTLTIPSPSPVKCYRPFSRKFFFLLGIEDRAKVTRFLSPIKSVATALIASLTSAPTIYHMKRVSVAKTAVNKSAKLKLKTVTL